MKIRVCSTKVAPKEMHITSSDGKRYYTMVPSGLYNNAVCTCPGFQFRNSCSHVTQAEELRCPWSSKDLTEILCPNCGSATVEFEVSPEYI